MGKRGKLSEAALRYIERFQRATEGYGADIGLTQQENPELRAIMLKARYDLELYILRVMRLSKDLVGYKKWFQSPKVYLIMDSRDMGKTFEVREVCMSEMRAVERLNELAKQEMGWSGFGLYEQQYENGFRILKYRGMPLDTGV